jgi:hypothetical protein
VLTARTCVLPAVLLLLASMALGAANSLSDLVRDGDIIFHTSRSAQSVAVQKATASKYSHMGLVLFRDGKPFVCEAIRTVQYTPLEKWVARGEGGHCVVKRLKDADRVLTATAVARLRRAADEFQGKPYDLTFEWSDARIYCSELVWKTYERGLGLQIGRIQKLREFNLTDPVVKARMQERYGERVPLDETVISPGEMFVFEGLSTVAEQ